MNKFVNTLAQTPTAEIYTEDFIKATRIFGIPADADSSTILSYGFDLLPTESNSKANDTDVLVANKDESNAWTSTWITASEWAATQAAQHRLVTIRAQRNQLLARTDWTQGKDIPDAVSSKWAIYRQQLRDITAQPGFPNTIEWPQQP